MGLFHMPSLGADMEAGTIIEWMVKPGDAVKRGDIVATVQTEKADIDIEVFETGVVEEILVPVGAKVAVGTPIATVTGETAAPAPPAPAAPAPPAPDRAAAPPPPAATPAWPPTPAVAPHVVSPVVRHLAERLGVDIAHVRPSRIGGVVTRADVEAAARRTAEGRPARQYASPYARKRAAALGVDLTAVVSDRPDGIVHAADVERSAAGLGAAPPAVPSPAEPAVSSPAEQIPRGMSRGLSPAVGRLMARSKRETPHYYLSHDIDLRAALDWMQAVNAERAVGERLLGAALLLRAVVLAAQEVPEMNGHYVDDGFRPSAEVHLGVAVAVRGGGLLAPVMRDAHRRSLDELMASMLDMVGRARRGALRGEDVEPATITVTNLGDQGVDGVWGVIIPPQVAIVGFGRIAERPWAENGLLGVRPVVTATLSADHRVSHGHHGARFLAAVARSLQNPEVLR